MAASWDRFCLFSVDEPLCFCTKSRVISVRNPQKGSRLRTALKRLVKALRLVRSSRHRVAGVPQRRSITQDLMQKTGSLLTEISSERPWGAQKHAGGVFALLCYAERVARCGSRGGWRYADTCSFPPRFF